ncbi:MAG: hypothetical protein C0511_09305 [Hyphomicrobium sp.]|nr:hypothetical protein [Hyphomicrobium sp.]
MRNLETYRFPGAIHGAGRSGSLGPPFFWFPRGSAHSFKLEKPHMPLFRSKAWRYADRRDTATQSTQVAAWHDDWGRMRHFGSKTRLSGFLNCVRLITA